jgi:hypothetical protein
VKILVNKCPDTGKLFELDAEYKTHRAKVLRKKRADAKAKKVKDTFFDWLAAEKLLITHPNQIPEWLLKNQWHLMEAINAGCRSKTYGSFNIDKFYDTDVFSSITFDREPVFKDETSNTHRCPDGGVTNFSCDSNRPRGYPGWSGHISGKLQRESKHDGSYPYGEFLNLVGIKTGSGGGGNKSWGYDFKLFLADWPGLQTEFKEILHQRHEAEADAIVRRLKNAGNNGRRTTF